MSTVPNDVPSTIDLAPLLALREEVDAMRARLEAGEKPDEAVFLDLEKRCSEAEDVMRDQLLAAVGSNADGFRGVRDDAWRIAALISGSLPLEALADETYAVERGDRALIAALRLGVERGVELAALRKWIDEAQLSEEASPEGVAAAEAFLASLEVAK